MSITKSEPDVSKNGLIKNGIVISNGVLTITREEGNLKYENKKWFVEGEDGKWYFLGYGANPGYTLEKNNISNYELFDNVFEEITQN